LESLNTSYISYESERSKLCFRDCSGCGSYALISVASDVTSPLDYFLSCSVIVAILPSGILLTNSFKYHHCLVSILKIDQNLSCSSNIMASLVEAVFWCSQSFPTFFGHASHNHFQSRDVPRWTFFLWYLSLPKLWLSFCSHFMDY